MPSLRLQAGIFSLLASAMAVPYGTGNVDTPYGMGNTTVVYNPTGTATTHSTITTTVHIGVSIVDSDAADVNYGQPASVDLTVAETLSCESVPTVTVTTTDRTTVTVTPGASPKESETYSTAKVDDLPSTTADAEIIETPESTPEAVPSPASDTESEVAPESTSEAESSPTPSPEADDVPEADDLPESDDLPDSTPEAAVGSDSPAPEVEDEVEEVPSSEPTDTANGTPELEEGSGEDEAEEETYPAPIPSNDLPSSAASSTPAATPTTTSSSGTGKGKRGLAYNDGSLTRLFEGSSQVTWAYNWGQTRDGLSESFEFVPTLWGTDSRFTNGWEKNAEDAIASGSTSLLAFNEPDHGEQANISPADAAAGYKTYMQPFAGKARLGSPGVTNGGGSMGLAWLDAFMSACDGCTIDFVAIHWYDSASNVEYFKKHIAQAHEQTGKPIWVTEFGAHGSDQEVDNFLREVLPWLDSQSYCERYSYFMVRQGLLVNGADKSAYGTTFAEL